jgi:Transposase DDE domain
MKELELIRLYFYLCECDNTIPGFYRQRFSPNSSPKNEKITDVELLTFYFYCRRYEDKHLKSTIYDFANRYLRSWFPDLPAYANFNSRLNNLGDTLIILVDAILVDLQNTQGQNFREHVSLIDSLPIILCSGKRSGKVAPELSNKSYCSSKGIYYFGVKLHAITFCRKGQLPLPEFLGITPAADNDLEAVRHILPYLVDREIFADKAYAVKGLNDELFQQLNTTLLTPVKLVKGETESTRQFKKAADQAFSTAVSVVRQPIESFFNWLIEKSNIQRAAKVRATKGLIAHVFGAIATALLFWRF